MSEIGGVNQGFSAEQLFSNNMEKASQASSDFEATMDSIDVTDPLALMKAQQEMAKVQTSISMMTNLISTMKDINNQIANKF